jgi:hypothetical protein
MYEVKIDHVGYTEYMCIIKDKSRNSIVIGDHYYRICDINNIEYLLPITTFITITPLTEKTTREKARIHMDKSIK